jgi:Lon-like protease
VVVLAAIAAVAGALYVIPSDHYLVLPDRARPADPLVTVPCEKKGDEGAGGIYMVDVLVRKASILERIFPGIENGSSLVPAEQVNPVGVSDEQRRESSLNEMSRSQQVAAAVALESLGRKVTVEENGVEVTLVRPDFPADGKLEIGDVIRRASGSQTRTTEQLRNVMCQVKPGDDVRLVVDRGDTRKEISVGTTRVDPEDPECSGAVFGVQIQQSADIELPVAVKIEAGNIGGPSAGLAFALDIVDELGRDLDHGKTVVATGAIQLDGTVDPIGGIQQKTIGARQAGADLFLVPDENAAEARRYADGMRIVAVSNFKESLSALAPSS